jgi:hypothetical protein
MSMNNWSFDPIHNHWKRDRWLIGVQFNERGTSPRFLLIHRGYDYGEYGLLSVPDREAGTFRTLAAAKARAEEAEIESS